jgi:hypothetical protein
VYDGLEEVLAGGFVTPWMSTEAVDPAVSVTGVLIAAPAPLALTDEAAIPSTTYADADVGITVPAGAVSIIVPVALSSVLGSNVTW